jgi:EAL domain-containing protein (putative c-di-GMP-specific phosphodiesterase class I)
VTNDSNIISFPAPETAASRRQSAEASPTAPVVDLADRRRALNSKLEADFAPATDRALTTDEIWEALNDNRIALHYQPQYDMRTGETVAVEGLVRLLDHNFQLVYPDRFIEAMEQSDLILVLGRCVIETACADLAELRAEGSELQRVAINLSARQLNVDSGLPEFIEETLNAYGLEFSDLEFELTERQRLSQQSIGPAVLQDLAERGARIVIDDFGIGFSSVAYLAELPISAIKLDRALVQRLPHDKATRKLVKGLLDLARSMDIEVVGEGIETAAQHEYLLRSGCEFAQGFAYAKPMTFAALQRFLSESHVAFDQSGEQSS